MDQKFKFNRMIDKFSIRAYPRGVFLWVFLVAVVVLVPVFTFMTMENIRRQKEIRLRLMTEKGAALIRSLEAGTRIGMMEVHWGHQRLKRLLSEMVLQPEIEYIFMTDVKGNVIVHDRDTLPKGAPTAGLDLKKLSGTEAFYHRVMTSGDDSKIFQVYKRFMPIGGRGMPMRKRMQHAHNMNAPWLTEDMKPSRGGREGDFIIFVGLSMDAFEASRSADVRNTIVMALVMLLVGIGGIMILFLAQAYRSARSSLSKVRAFSEQLMEQAPIGLIAMDPQMTVTAFNQAAKQLLGVSGMILGRDAETFVPADLLVLIQGLSLDCRLIEREVSCHVSERNELLPLQVTAASLYDDSRFFLGYILLFKDLSEIRALHEAVTRNQRLATVGRLAAGVAHEIRNPLSSLKGFATYFKEQSGASTEAQNISAIMIQEVDRLNRVVGQLLDFSKPLKLAPVPFDVNGFVTNSVDRVRQLAADKKITIKLTALTEAVEVIFDGDKINQVLLNLYLNAIEAMDPGGVLQVSLSVNADLRFLIRVSDTGKGIEREDLSHIFDPYFTTKSSGTGLGLAIVHNIIEAHGGEVHVDSTPGSGTTVTVGLPMVKG